VRTVFGKKRNIKVKEKERESERERGTLLPNRKKSSGVV
jgi:hypothetical protein